METDKTVYKDFYAWQHACQEAALEVSFHPGEHTCLSMGKTDVSGGHGQAFLVHNVGLWDYNKKEGKLYGNR
jgi:hypothetical protein